MALLAAACGSGSMQGGGSDVVIVPDTATVAQNGQASFTASLSSLVQGVSWALQEASAGTLAPDGLAVTYTASVSGQAAAPGTYTLVATSVDDPRKSGRATITVVGATQAVSVAVSPSSAPVAAGATQDFSCVVSGSSDKACTWTADAGTLTPIGSTVVRYTAPQAPGSYRVVATAHADTTKTFTATAAVTSASGGLTIAGPTLVSPRERELKYTKVGANVAGRTYRWTIGTGGQTCINQRQDYGASPGCVVNYGNGETVTDTTSTGYGNPSTLIVSAPATGTLTIALQEFSGSTVTASGSLTVSIQNGRRSWRVALPSGKQGEAAGWSWVPADRRVAYPSGRVYSPVDASVAAWWRNVAAHAGSDKLDNSFIKVGDSITQFWSFLGGGSGAGTYDTQQFLGAGQICTSASCATHSETHGIGYEVKLGDGTVASTLRGGLTVRPDDTDLVPTIQHFRTAGITALDRGNVESGAATPLRTRNGFSRYSIAALAGQQTAWPLSSRTGFQAPNPLTAEIAAMTPRWAIVMLGNNDLGPPATSLQAIVPQMWTLLTTMTETHGIVPVLSALSPDTSQGRKYTPWVPHVNAALRGLAQGLQLPFVDLYEELTKDMFLPQPTSCTQVGDHWGLNSDGTHLTNQGGVQTGWSDYSAAGTGMAHGVPHRNITTVRAFSRVLDAVMDGVVPQVGARPDGRSFDPAAPTLVAGDGTAANPFLVDTAERVHTCGGEIFQWGDLGSSLAAHMVAGKDFGDGTSRSYSCAGASGAATTTGPRFVYQLTLGATRPIRIELVERNGVPNTAHHVYLLKGSTCLRSAVTEIAGTVGAGTYTVVVDTVNRNSARGDYLIAVAGCDPADTACGTTISP